MGRGNRLRWLRTAVLACTAVALLLAVVYLAAVNAFLSTTLSEEVLDDNPDRLLIRYRRAWSLLPGRIHAQDLVVRSRDANVEWILRIDEVRFNLSFLALAKRHFVASHVRGHGGSFRLRRRIDALQLTPESTEDLPPIEGFRSIPIRPFRQCKDEWEPGIRLWTVTLEDVVGEAVREVWVDHVRFEGLTTAAGRFYLNPGRSIAVGPVHVDVREGRVRIRRTPWVDSIAATAEFTMPRLDPRIVHGMDLVHQMTFTVDVNRASTDLAGAPLLQSHGLQVHGIVDVRHAAVAVKNGVLQGEGGLDANVPVVEVARGDLRLTGKVGISATIARVERGDALALRAEIDGARLERSAHPLVRAPRIEVRGDAKQLDLVRAFEDLHIVGTVNDAELPDLRALAVDLPEKARVTLVRGRARADALVDVRLADKRVASQVAVRAEDIDLHVSNVRARAAAAAAASVGSFDWETASLDDLRASVRAHDLAVVAGPVHLWADVAASARVGQWDLGGEAFDVTASAELARVRGRLRLDGPATFGAKQLRVVAAAPRLDLAHPSLRAIGARLTIAGAEMPDLKALQPFVPDSARVKVESGRADLAAHVALAGSTAKGNLQVDVRGPSVRVGSKPIAAGRATAMVFVRGFDWQRGILDLSGSGVSLDDVSVGSPPAAPAQARLMLRDTAVTVFGSPRADSNLALRVSDAEPLLEGFLREHIPKILAGLIAVPSVVASTRLTAAEGGLQLRDVDLRAGNLAVEGLLAVKGKQHLGAFTAKKGVLAVGLRLDGQGAHAHFFGLERWLRRETPAVLQILDVPEPRPIPR